MSTDAPVQRVTTLELFFDLVFVFTITQVSRLVSGAPPAAAFGHAALILTIAWWMYGGYAWLTNNIRIDGVGTRITLLAGMAAYLVMALAIPRANGADGLVFGVAFLLVTIVHAILFTRAPNSSARAIVRLAPWNLLGAGFTIAAGWLDPSWRWVAWSAAVATFALVNVTNRERGFHINAAHFAERHGLVIIVAIGESVVALGSSIGETAISAPLVVAVLLGFALCASIWWSYFDGDDTRGEAALAAIPADRRPRKALFAYSYAHLGMIAGIVGVAAGLHDVIARPAGPVAWAGAWALAGGVALYLESNKLFRTWLEIASSRWRFLAAALALGAAPIGARVAGEWEVAALVTLTTGMLIVERRGRR